MPLRRMFLLPLLLPAALVGQGHWAFVPPRTHETPVVGGAWARGPIDAFVQEGLERAGIKPAPRARDQVLVRRLHLDLTGLPPTLREIAEFLEDDRPDRFGRLVERVLESPHFGERMAMPWLDAARYADTNGFSIDDHRDMWAWRDWVIKAFNDNMPHDRFLRLQLAGDLVEDATDTTRLATGFLRNGANTHEGGTLPQEYRVIYIADKVDTVASAYMGLTMRCAQCHDHKYDPISQREYYGMYAFFDTAHEPGQGAVNGNTKPTISVVPPIGGTAMLRRRTRERIEELEAARRHPSDLVVARKSWEESARARLAPAPSDDLLAEFKMPALDAKSGQPVRWIWSDRTGGDRKISLHRTLTLKEAPSAAVLLFSCDNAAQVKVNGKTVARLDDWLKPVAVDLRGSLQAGDNVITVEATNHGGPAGLALVLQYTVAGAVRHLVSDATWKVGSVNGRPSRVAAVEVGPYGAAPWGDVLAGALTGLGLPVAFGTSPAERSDDMWAVINEAFARADPRMRHHLDATAREIGILRGVEGAGRASVMVMKEQGPRQTYVLTRGEYDQPDRAQPVAPHVPAAFPPLPEGRRDRLGLARWLTMPEHPLTSRVAVNRIWQMLFGRGLVATPDDFGLRGAAPSHPELLDTLARDFEATGWDVKGLIRRIVHTSTYRQSSDTTKDSLTRDHDNRWLGRGARFRLSAESVRDNALVIADSLNRTIGGPPVYPPQPSGLWREVSHYGYAPAFTAQAFFPSRDRNASRRSLYSFWKRTSPPPAMTTFDAPNREVCTLKRSRTNTPLQALVLLNDPQFVAAARGLASWAMARAGALEMTDSVAMGEMFRKATARRPDPFERAILERRLEVARIRYAADPDGARALLRDDSGDRGDEVRRAAWTVVASIILNLDEVVTRR